MTQLDENKVDAVIEQTSPEIEEFREKESDDIVINESIEEIEQISETDKIDEELLHMTNVKLINTCSTGMNHIDVEYCSENEIEIMNLLTQMNKENNQTFVIVTHSDYVGGRANRIINMKDGEVV